MNIALGVSKCSSNVGRSTLHGDIGGVAYNGDMQPMSERSKMNKGSVSKKKRGCEYFKHKPKLIFCSSAFIKMSE